MKDSTTFHWDGKLSSAVEVRKRPGPSGECGGSGTRWRVLVSWLEVRENQTSGQWNCRPTSFSGRRASENLWILPRLQWGKEEKGETCLQEKEVCLHHSPLLRLETPLPRARSSPGGPSVPGECRLASGASRQGRASIASSSACWTLWMWMCHGLSPQISGLLRAGSNSHICSQLPSVYRQNSSPAAQPRPFSCGLYSKPQQLTVPLHTFRYPQILSESKLDICMLTQALCPLRICHQHPFTHLPQKPEIQPHHNPIQWVTSSYRLHFLTVANLFFPLRSHHHWINSVPHHSFPGVVHHLQRPRVTLLPILFLPISSPYARRMSFQKCIYNPVTPLLKTLWWCLKQSQKANDKMGGNICITYDKELTSLIYSEYPYTGEKTNRKMGKGYKQAFHPLGMKWSTNLW